THQTDKNVLQLKLPAVQGLTRVAALVQAAPVAATVLPKSPRLLEAQTLQLPEPGVLFVAATPPLRIQPMMLVGGPTPLSSELLPRTVLYDKLEVSKISGREAMWYPLAQPVTALLPCLAPGPAGVR